MDKTNFVKITEDKRKYLEAICSELMKNPTDKIPLLLSDTRPSYFLRKDIADPIRVYLQHGEYFHTNSSWLNEVRDWYINTKKQKQ